MVLHALPPHTICFGTSSNGSPIQPATCTKLLNDRHPASYSITRPGRTLVTTGGVWAAAQLELVLMTDRTFAQQIGDFVAERDWAQFHSPENLAKSINIEAGELLECFQWSGEYDPSAVAAELADVYTYCILLADQLGVELDDIGLAKLHESAAKYPVSKARGRSTKYTEL